MSLVRVTTLPSWTTASLPRTVYHLRYRIGEGNTSSDRTNSRQAYALSVRHTELTTIGHGLSKLIHACVIHTRLHRTLLHRRLLDQLLMGGQLLLCSCCIEVQINMDLRCILQVVLVLISLTFLTAEPRFVVFSADRLLLHGRRNITTDGGVGGARRYAHSTIISVEVAAHC